MKKFILCVAIALMIIPASFSQAPLNPSVTVKNGWLIYWADHKIWMEAGLDSKAKASDFFKDSLYKNAIRMPSHYKANFLGMFAHPYVVTNHHPRTGKGKLNIDTILILPVKAEIKERTVEQEDIQTVTFYYKDKKVKIEYRFDANYTIENIEALTKEDRARINRYLKKKGWTIEDALKEQKGAF